nr:hypothetical protein HmN_000946100 [Hymenolepis microstoma]
MADGGGASLSASLDHQQRHALLLLIALHIFSRRMVLVQLYIVIGENSIKPHGKIVEVAELEEVGNRKVADVVGMRKKL